MDQKWRDTLFSSGRALVDDVKGIRTRDADELWEAYLTFLVQKQERPALSKAEFMIEIRDAVQ
jgi:hypothetical protein